MWEYVNSSSNPNRLLIVQHLYSESIVTITAADGVLWLGRLEVLAVFISENLSGYSLFYKLLKSCKYFRTLTPVRLPVFDRKQLWSVKQHNSPSSSQIWVLFLLKQSERKSRRNVFFKVSLSILNGENWGISLIFFSFLLLITMPSVKVQSCLDNHRFTMWKTHQTKLTSNQIIVICFRTCQQGNLLI